MAITLRIHCTAILILTDPTKETRGREAPLSVLYYFFNEYSL